MRLVSHQRMASHLLLNCPGCKSHAERNTSTPPAANFRGRGRPRQKITNYKLLNCQSLARLCRRSGTFEHQPYFESLLDSQKVRR